MRDNAGHYHVLIRESTRGRWAVFATIHDRVIDDPFVRAAVRPSGRRTALAVLRGRYEVRFQVDGTSEAHRVIFTGDYGRVEGPSETVGLGG